MREFFDEHAKLRKVLDCASPLALSVRAWPFAKRQRAGALQDVAAALNVP